MGYRIMKLKPVKISSRPMKPSTPDNRRRTRVLPSTRPSIRCTKPDTFASQTENQGIICPLLSQSA